METAVIRVTGMTCRGCVSSVKNVLSGLDGVQSVDVSLEQVQATVVFDAARTGPSRIRSAIEDAGYETA